MNIDNYLKRIDYNGDTVPTYEVLCALQRQHLYHVPFENYHIHDRIPIALDLDSLYTKVITRQRGGFCYELNYLFYNLLRQLGFQVKIVEARVYGNGEFGAPFDHMAIIATLDATDYLCDVGFGEFSLQPLVVKSDEVQQDARGDFLIAYDDNCFIAYKCDVSDKTPEYQFNLVPRKVEDFQEMCHYHQTSEKSHFTQKRLISLATEIGRITISGDTLIVRQHGEIVETTLSPEGYRQALRQYFPTFAH